MQLQKDPPKITLGIFGLISEALYFWATIIQLWFNGV